MMEFDWLGSKIQMVSYISDNKQMAPRFLERLTKKRRTSRVHPSDINGYDNSNQFDGHGRDLSAPTVPITTSLMMKTSRSNGNDDLQVQKKRRMFGGLEGAVKRVMIGLKKWTQKGEGEGGEEEEEVDISVTCGDITFMRPVVDECIPMVEQSAEQQLIFNATLLDGIFNGYARNFDESEINIEEMLIPEDLLAQVEKYQKLIREYYNFVPLPLHFDEIKDEIKSDENFMETKIEQSESTLPSEEPSLQSESFSQPEPFPQLESSLQPEPFIVPESKTETEANQPDLGQVPVLEHETKAIMADLDSHHKDLTHLETFRNALVLSSNSSYNLTELFNESAGSFYKEEKIVPKSDNLLVRSQSLASFILPNNSAGKLSSPSPVNSSDSTRRSSSVTALIALFEGSTLSMNRSNSD
jgi:hypothetical protein